MGDEDMPVVCARLQLANGRYLELNPQSAIILGRQDFAACRGAKQVSRL